MLTWVVLTIVIDAQPTGLLIQTGIYRRVRYPHEAGMILFWLALGLLITNWLVLAVAFTVTTSTGVLVVILDRAKMRWLGDAYREYQQRTAYLVPGLF
jgi:protein-S-isoprenylcysteine O-methyltransferase Ste14